MAMGALCSVLVSSFFSIDQVKNELKGQVYKLSAFRWAITQSYKKKEKRGGRRRRSGGGGGGGEEDEDDKEDEGGGGGVGEDGERAEPDKGKQTNVLQIHRKRLKK